MMRRLLKLLFAVILFSAAVFAGIMTSEYYLRNYKPQLSDKDLMFERDPRLGWRFAAGKSGRIVFAGEVDLKMRTNPQGFRDKPFETVEKQKRIMVLGDSFVSNISVPQESVFTELIEKKLQDTSVMNLGVNGYGQVQEYRLMQEMIPRYKPNLVIFTLYIGNDFFDNNGDGWLAISEFPYARFNAKGNDVEIIMPPPLKHETRKEPAIIKDSHLYHYLRFNMKLLKARLIHWVHGDNKGDAYSFWEPPELMLCKKSLSFKAELLYRITEMMLVRIDNYCKSQKVPVLYVVAPSYLQIEDKAWKKYYTDANIDPNDFYLAYPNRRLVNFAAKHKLQMLDLYPRLKAESLRGKKLYYDKEQHWTAEGNAIAADEILNYGLKNKKLKEYFPLPLMPAPVNAVNEKANVSHPKSAPAAVSVPAVIPPKVSAEKKPADIPPSSAVKQTASSGNA